MLVKEPQAVVCTINTSGQLLLFILTFGLLTAQLAAILRIIYRNK